MSLDPHKIIKNLEEEIIDTMLVKFFIDDEIMDLGRGLQLQALSDSAISTGVDYVFNKCTKPILFELEKGETYVTGGPDNEKSRSKPIVVENLSFKCAERGFEEFLKGKPLDTIEKIAEKLKVDGEDKEELIENILEEANYQGLSKMFEAFSPKILKDWCAMMDIQIDSTSKKRLAKGLIYGEDSGPTSTRQYGKAEEEKVKLEASTTEEDIKKSYTVNELKKFCTESKIPALGTKDVLVNRIYRFLQGEKIDENEGKRKRSDADDSPTPEKKQKVLEEPEPEPSISSTSEEDDDSFDDYNENGTGGKKQAKRASRTKKTDEDEDEPMGEAEETPIQQATETVVPASVISTPVSVASTSVPVSVISTPVSVAPTPVISTPVSVTSTPVSVAPTPVISTPVSVAPTPVISTPVSTPALATSAPVTSVITPMVVETTQPEPTTTVPGPTETSPAAETLTTEDTLTKPDVTTNPSETVTNDATEPTTFPVIAPEPTETSPAEENVTTEETKTEVTTSNTQNTPSETKENTPATETKTDPAQENTDTSS